MTDLFNQPKEDPVHILSVSELTGELKMMIEDHFDWINVRGEVSQPKTSRNGHLYFTLKDDTAQLPCVMWRSKRQSQDYLPEHGDEIVAAGPLQVYAPHGRYQMIVQSLRPAGLGALQQAFEQLKKKLQDEGLFDENRKKPIPRFPEVIGIVTSATGAAFQDMKNTLEKRYPLCEIRLFHASVQGSQAAPEISDAIRFFSGQDDIELLIIGRGGGSLEDLWAFNEEIVARAIAECRIPVISAVGHETDFSISDFVADARAATPTQAIIMAVPDQNDLKMKIEDLQMTLEMRVKQLLEKHKETVSRFLDNYALHKVRQRIARNKEQLEWKKQQAGQLLRIQIRNRHEEIRRLSDAVQNSVSTLLLQKKSRWNELHQKVLAADPNKPLKKGYTRIRQQGAWIRSSHNFRSDAGFEIEWSDKTTPIDRAKK
ncbi:exodeoxyribonuclease VII large subunit [Natronogracilivirga saccharolytica]|uniref:Exodeoxyribonuclease 7 large subunit n=1 Tax=Natronogracilivirga saccharolytica TaxID=2812953 RepID=A0A8J7RH68_9BACT|nr:exodeoxyribonuclease VII large subunit [Natronogracilivirga saccharolytica]MBP3191137.1 exodeoxyribonuclease VII large subunit [Natronogracilivirga saccharolytica]